MGDERKCTELPGTLIESFTLAIELVGYEVKNGPSQITKVLQDPKVQAKIKEALEKRLGELQKKAMQQGRPIDSQQALEEVKSVFTVDTLDTAKEALKKQLEQSGKYRQLKSSLDNLSCKFKEHPIGFFYDEAEGVLVIVTVGLWIAGVAGAYVAATGDLDTVTTIAGKLAEQIEIPVIGQVSLGIADVVLKPSEKKYDAGLFARVSKWKAVEKAELKVTVQTKDEKVAAIPISVETKVGVAPGWFQNFAGTYDPVNGKAVLSLGISSKFDQLEVQVKADYMFDDKLNKQSIGGSGSFDWKPAPEIPINVTGGLGYSRMWEEVPNANALSGGPTTKATNNVQMNLGLKVLF
jgi:hypothetical protein